MLLTIPRAEAAEVDFEGYYRARGRLFHSLSIDSDLTGYEGTSAWAEHRFWLRPRFLINDQVGVFAELRGLDNLVWGSEARSYFDPTTADNVPLAYIDDLTPPIPTEQDHTPVLLDITLWRAWGEVHLGQHRFRLGRMPLHWGSGVWQNDGLGLNGEYGDTADRIQWEGLFGDVYASVAVDVTAESFVNQSDNTMSYNGMAAWRTEQVVAGLNLQFRHSDDPEDGQGLNLFTADIALDAELGQLELHVEAVARFGEGDLDTGLNDVQIATGGGIVEGRLYTDAVDLGLVFAMATGDANLTDNRLKTFTFDRDYNLGIILFEHPLPTLASSIPTSENEGRDYTLTVTGPAVSNALLLRPKVSRHFGDDWKVEAMGVFARTARVPQTDAYADRKFYGSELDASVSYEGLEHLDLQGTVGVFFPGGYYSNFENLGISGVVFGGQVVTRIRF
jgi:hypothetical protein